MNRILLCLLLTVLTGHLKADTLDLVFRLYDAQGLPVSFSNTGIRVPETGKATRVYGVKEDTWQQWQVIAANNSPLLIVYAGDTVKLQIDVHRDCRNGRVKTVVFSRIQATGKIQVAKINYLTCRLTGTIAYPLDYQFMNVLDGKTLALQTISSQKYVTAVNTTISVLSDSVMLFACDEKNAVFIKYRLQSDGIITLETSNVSCENFLSQFHRDLYLNLLRYGELRYLTVNDRFYLQAGDHSAEFIIEK